MRAIYPWLLYLYPAEFRRQFGEEMALVFGDASAAASRAGLGSQLSFAMHEFAGVVCGAVSEHVRSISPLNLVSRRIAMISQRPRFRFPVAGITLMVLTFAGIVFVIHYARKIALSLAGQTYMFNGQMETYRPDHLSFVQTFGFAFGLTVVCAVVVWAVLHTLHRSGVHRLSEAQTWPAK